MAWYDNVASGDSPFAPFYNPAYYATGGGSPSTIQDPNRLPRRGRDGANAPNTVTGRPTDQTRASRGEVGTHGVPVGTWNATPPELPYRSGGGAPTKPQMTGLRPPASPYGSQSGPGILENWFNMRASGTDPAFEYGLKRGNEALGNRYSAAGAYNSGAARQGEADLYANLVSQREGQLDALAGGASGEHQNRLNSMFSQGLGLAGGQAGVGGAYDITSANSNNALMSALIQLLGNKAGVDNQSNQQGLSNLAGLYSLGA